MNKAFITGALAASVIHPGKSGPNRVKPTAALKRSRRKMARASRRINRGNR